VHCKCKLEEKITRDIGVDAVGSLEVVTIDGPTVKGVTAEYVVSTAAEDAML
jgi:hypothetical protein